MRALLIVSNEAINKNNNDVLFKITQLEIDARHETIASQECIVAMFAAILAKDVPPS